ncbi:MAG: hypothetical protein QOH49_89 [Acidobacteriota bacterium]|nr:hypothetical protein [Acidobacteriota bacterium]
MTYPWQEGKTVVSRLRVEGRNLDPLVTKLRVASMFGAVHLGPVTLPPSAILCIRRLSDPLPGGLSLDGGQPFLPPAWEQAFVASVRGKCARAIRPLRGGVTSEAEAVIFSDRSELLACLAQDWCAGQTGERWWWRSLFKGEHPGVYVVRAWAESPEYVPAGLQHLAVNGGLTSFVRALSATDALTILTSITRSFELPDLQAALLAGLCGASAARADEPEAEEGADGHASFEAQPIASHVATGEGVKPLPPWQPWVPESLVPALGRERQCLLGVGLLLRRAPAAARSTTFARAALRWLGAGDAAQTGRRPGVATAGRKADTLAASSPPHTRSHDGGAEHAHVPTASRPDVQTSPRPDARDANVSASEAATPPSVTLPSPPRQAARENGRTDTQARELARGQSIARGHVGQTSAEVLRQEGRPDAYVRATARGATTAEAGDALAAPDVLFDAQVETEFGGVFYLVNLGLFLNLYADFTSPLEDRAALPIFDFVSLLGRRLVGGHIEGDPVWPLLALLAGRDELEEPGKDFVPPAEWRVPADWLEPFPANGLWRWDADGESLRVRHPEGFLILDAPLPADVDPARQLAREMETYLGVTTFTLRRGSFDAARRDVRAAWWFDNLTKYVRARLRRALGARTAKAAAYMLCRQRARVLVTPTHLDVVFMLAELPVEIRLAGLDRNPGWVPAAGKFIAFHYE